MGSDVALRYPVNALASYHYFAETDMDALCRMGLRCVGDSGAFSAANANAPISLDSFAAWASRWQRSLAWVASLDKIGDERGSWRNYRELRDSYKLNVIPTVHYGADPTALDRYAADGVDFVGLGGMVPYKAQIDRLMRWCVAMFRYARDTHPQMRFHGWGVTSPRMIVNLPWYSVDSSKVSTAGRYGLLHLFNPRTGKTSDVAVNGRAMFAEADLLRDVYGVEPADVAVLTKATSRPVMRLAVASMQRREDYVKRRLGPVPAPSYGITRRHATAGPHIHVVQSGASAFQLLNRQENAA